MKIKVYTTTTCPYCAMLKKFLDEHKIAFKEALVDQDDAAMEEMMSVSDGHRGVPFTVITKDDGGVEKIVGFDETKFRDVLDV